VERETVNLIANTDRQHHHLRMASAITRPKLPSSPAHPADAHFVFPARFWLSQQRRNAKSAMGK
jgi:hypothetical protein